MPQLLDLPLGGLDAFALAAGQSITLAAVDLLALEPFQQGLGHSADLRCNGLNVSPSLGVLASVLVHQPRRTLPSLKGKLVRFFHGSSSQKFEPPQNAERFVLQRHCVRRNRGNQLR